MSCSSSPEGAAAGSSPSSRESRSFLLSPAGTNPGLASSSSLLRTRFSFSTFASLAALCSFQNANSAIFSSWDLSLWYTLRSESSLDSEALMVSKCSMLFSSTTLSCSFVKASSWDAVSPYSWTVLLCCSFKLR